MIEPRDLLRGRVAPAPLAIEMPTEIRTDGGLMLQILQAPAWAGMDGAAVFAEWSCGLQHDKLAKLRDFLAEPSTTTGLQPEAAIDQALRNLRFTGKDVEIGHLIGIYAAEGTGFCTPVRFMFAFTPKLRLTIEDVNRAIFQLLTLPHGDVEKQASAALRKLRAFWREGEQPAETRWMMLSQTDPSNPEQNPFLAVGI